MTVHHISKRRFTPDEYFSGRIKNIAAVKSIHVCGCVQISYLYSNQYLNINLAEKNVLIDIHIANVISHSMATELLYEIVLVLYRFPSINRKIVRKGTSIKMISFSHAAIRMFVSLRSFSL